MLHKPTALNSRDLVPPVPQWLLPDSLGDPERLSLHARRLDGFHRLKNHKQNSLKVFTNNFMSYFYRVSQSSFWVTHGKVASSHKPSRSLRTCQSRRWWRWACSRRAQPPCSPMGKHAERNSIIMRLFNCFVEKTYVIVVPTFAHSNNSNRNILNWIDFPSIKDSLWVK